MKILYHIPSLHTVSAGRTIYAGYKNAFTDLGHTFRPLTADDDQAHVFCEFQPDILMTSMGPYVFKYLDFEALKRQKRHGMRVFVNIPQWKSPMSKLRVNEVVGLSDNKEYIKLIHSGDFGDAYYNVCEQGDGRMDGFEKASGQRHHTVLLAADKTLIYPDPDSRFQADLSYIGTFLPEKKPFFEETIFPLRKRYNVRLYGQDWTTQDRFLGLIHKFGMYFNLPILKSIRKPALGLDDERKIYSSTTICINIHEAYQRQYGDLNERTFKIPLAGGFEIIDDVPTLSKYFSPGKHLVIAQNRDDWHDKIEYYMHNETKRHEIADAGRKHVLEHHTYHNRINQLLNIYKNII